VNYYCYCYCYWSRLLRWGNTLDCSSFDIDAADDLEWNCLICFACWTFERFFRLYFVNRYLNAAVVVVVDGGIGCCYLKIHLKSNSTVWTIDHWEAYALHWTCYYLNCCFLMSRYYH
jgi:hypothetical protein